MKLNRIFMIKKVLPVVLGALGGYLYYHFIGCTQGSCPIQGNPYLSTGYGALLGSIFIMPEKKKAASAESERGK